MPSPRTPPTSARDTKSEGSSAGSAELSGQANTDPPERIVPTTTIDGIVTRYDVIGAGPPLLMLSPGGFDATIEKWRTQGVYTRLKLLDHLPATYSCIVYDRRESG